MSKNKVDIALIRGLYDYMGGFREKYRIFNDSPIMNKYSECRIFIPKNKIVPELIKQFESYPGAMNIVNDIGGIFQEVFCTKNTKLIKDSFGKSDMFGGYIMPGTPFYYFVHIESKDDTGIELAKNMNLDDFENLKKAFDDIYEIKKQKKQLLLEDPSDPIIHTFDIYKFTPKKGAKRTKAELLSEAEELRKEIKQTKIPAVKQTEEVPKLIKQAGSKIKRNKMVSDIEKLLADMGELKSKVHPDKKISKLISEAEAIVKQKRKVKGKGIEDSMAKAMPGLVQMFSLFK